MALNVVESSIMQISSYQDFDLKPDRPYKIYMAERNNYGIVLKPKTKILETTEELEDYSVDLVKGFKQPEVKTIGEGKLLEIGTRLTVANVQIKKIGETQISGRRRWRIITIENHEEEANVTLWGQTVTIGDTPEINAEINMNVCCVTTATFEGEKVFYSTPLTKFEERPFANVCEVKSSQMSSMNYYANAFELHLYKCQRDHYANGFELKPLQMLSRGHYGKTFTNVE
ncbi:unnamed protein product [Mytilus edulis]|uniref:Uncharacterized protein n=1 Tax=Mytilus edulis TaxID=6550 RepID=A0A8S3T9X5_MYTED|nr:unnamed protein product [Mytilus edulis]